VNGFEGIFNTKALLKLLSKGKHVPIKGVLCNGPLVLVMQRVVIKRAREVRVEQRRNALTRHNHGVDRRRVVQGRHEGQRHPLRHACLDDAVVFVGWRHLAHGVGDVNGWRCRPWFGNVVVHGATRQVSTMNDVGQREVRSGDVKRRLGR